MSDTIVGTAGSVADAPVPAAPPVITGGVVTPDPVPAVEQQPPPLQQPEPEKKRGFWSRIFGVGKDKKKPPRPR